MNEYSSIGQLAGSVAGLAIGGPAGASLGAMAGGTLGSIANLFVPVDAPRTVYDVSQSYGLLTGNANYNENAMQTTSMRTINERTITVKEDSPALQALKKIF